MAQSLAISVYKAFFKIKKPISNLKSPLKFIYSIEAPDC